MGCMLGPPDFFETPSSCWDECQVHPTRAVLAIWDYNVGIYRDPYSNFAERCGFESHCSELSRLPRDLVRRLPEEGRGRLPHMPPLDQRLV